MVKRLRVIDSQDSTQGKPSDRGAAAAAKRKKIFIDSEDESEAEAVISVPSIAKESSPIPTSDLGPKKNVSQKKRQSGVNIAQEPAPGRPRRACAATSSSNRRANVELNSHPPATDSNAVEAGKEYTGGKF